jgi:aerobic-type carbon monoxide dehydrogenase small subunit (CoxS/CutS family)
MPRLVIAVNGTRHAVSATPDTPLLYVLRNELNLRGPKFGCGLAQCGACAVLLDGAEIRSCVTPVVATAGRRITTVEGLPALHGGDKHALHPVQQAWIDEQVPQCGYCQSGMVIQAVSLLAENKHPSDSEIRAAMNGHLCRCGTHNAIVRAIKRAAAAMAGKETAKS